MSATPSVLSLALIGSLVLSGCAFPGGNVGKAFDAIEAPIWEPGYSWTYDVVASSQMSGFDRGGLGSDSDSQRGRVTMTVLNTTKEVHGEPVYVVSLGEGFDHPLFEGDTQALTQRDLELAAIGYTQRYYSPGGSDPCRGASPLQPVEGSQRLPTVQFPLDDGASWTGSLGIEEDFGMQYTMSVHGLVDVQTPAGSFQAVYVTTDFQPGDMPEGGAEGLDMSDFSLRSEQWYSPDVKYLVKHVFTASASASEGGDRYQFAYRTTAVLSEYSLEAGPEQESPEIMDRMEPTAVRYEPTRIVSDTEFPVNIADGPVTARLTLEPMNTLGYGYQDVIAYKPELQTVAYDNETHEIGWTVTTYSNGYTEEARSTGDILELAMERGGEYQVRAAIQPKKCGANMVSDAYGRASAFWSKTFEFETGSGDLPQTIDIADVPVEVNAYEAMVSWVREPKVGYSTDQANVVIRGPDGHVQSYSANSPGRTDFSAYPAGLHAVSWQTTGLPSMGEFIELTVTITYGYVGMYH